MLSSAPKCFSFSFKWRLSLFRLKPGKQRGTSFFHSDILCHFVFANLNFSVMSSCKRNPYFFLPTIVRCVHHEIQTRSNCCVSTQRNWHLFSVSWCSVLPFGSCNGSLQSLKDTEISLLLIFTKWNSYNLSVWWIQTLSHLFRSGG